MIPRLAWRNLWRHRRRTVITAFAMAFGVAMCMGFIAFADGMFATMFDRMVGLQVGHAQVHHPDYPKQRSLYATINDHAKLERELAAVEGVGATSSRVFGYGLLGVGDEATGGQITGIAPEDEHAVRQLRDRVVEGEYLGDEPDQKMLLGYKLAEDLKAKVGAEVVVVSQAADGSLANELYEVVGLLRTGVTAIDRAGALVHRTDAQELLVLPDQVHEVAILATDAQTIDAMYDGVDRVLQGRDELLLRKWNVLNPMGAQYVAMQDAMYIILLLIILGIAGMGVLNTMLMSVFERTKELGVMIALGLKPRAIVLLVMMETFLLSLLAIAGGLVMGAALDAYLVRYGIYFGTELEFGGIIFDPYLKAVVHPEPIVLTAVLVILISLLSSLWPALRAARLQPVTAMREE